jgi:hypothetical protein
MEACHGVGDGDAQRLDPFRRPGDVDPVERGRAFEPAVVGDLAPTQGAAAIEEYDGPIGRCLCRFNIHPFAPLRLRYVQMYTICQIKKETKNVH